MLIRVCTGIAEHVFYHCVSGSRALKLLSS